MRRWVLTAMLIGVLPALAQDRLEPKGFSPDDRVLLRVEEIRVGSIATSIIVVAENRRNDVITVELECSLYDASDRALGSHGGLIENVAPMSEVVKTLTNSSRDIAKAVCRVTDIWDPS